MEKYGYKGFQLLTVNVQYCVDKGSLFHRFGATASKA